MRKFDSMNKGKILTRRSCNNLCKKYKNIPRLCSLDIVDIAQVVKYCKKKNKITKLNSPKEEVNLVNKEIIEGTTVYADALPSDELNYSMMRGEETLKASPFELGKF